MVNLSINPELASAWSEMTATAVKPEWTHALGKIPSGLFIVTLNSPQGETGFLASWIQQCSFDPPQLTFCVGKDRPVSKLLKAGTPVGINVIPEGGKSLIAYFGKRFAPGEPALRGLAVDRKAGAAPHLTAALAWLDCRVVASQDVGDHTLVVAKIVDGSVQHEGKPTVHIRRDG